MTSPKNLAIKLRTLMPAHGFDQAELARRSGIRPNSISRYLAGLNMPRPGQLAKLAAALHVGVGELLAEHDAPPPIDGGSNLVRLTQSTASPHLVRLQVDQSVPGDVATHGLEILLQAQKRIGRDVLPACRCARAQTTRSKGDCTRTRSLWKPGRYIATSHAATAGTRAAGIAARRTATSAAQRSDGR